jgi:hypothetical protein
MEDDILKYPEVGELIWQCRIPGGFCILLEESEVPSGSGPEIYYTVLHPTEGLVQDPSYYYQTIESALEDYVREFHMGLSS